MAVVGEHSFQPRPEKHFQLKNFVIGLVGVAFIAFMLNLPSPQTVGELAVHLLPMYTGMALFARAIWKLATTPDRFHA